MSPLCSQSPSQGSYCHPPLLFSSQLFHTNFCKLHLSHIHQRQHFSVARPRPSFKPSLLSQYSDTLLLSSFRSIFRLAPSEVLHANTCSCHFLTLKLGRPPLSEGEVQVKMKVMMHPRCAPWAISFHSGSGFCYPGSWPPQAPRASILPG